MRIVPIAPNEYYHILNRGNNKQPIFLDTRDWARFLFLIIYMQSPIIFKNLSRYISHYIKNQTFNVSENDIGEIVNKRNVKLINFALMPNHFHLTVYELKEGGIASYMQRILCAYTKYFNKKYERIGHLFQGPYKAVHVENNEQLLYLSSYIHKNPQEIFAWQKKPHLFPWSSYQDYIKENRWDNLVQQDIISDQFRDRKEYRNFVRSSPAKELKEKLGEELLLDINL